MRLRRFSRLGAALLALAGGVSACATEAELDRTGTLRNPCFRNGTCSSGLECISGVCVDPDNPGGAGGMASGGAGGVGGVGGTAQGGTAQGGAAQGGSGGGGQAGMGGTGGTQAGAGGTGGTTTGPCQAPNHTCAGMCVPNKPENGCTLSLTCAPCPAPMNGFATCTAGGDCAFSCNSGFQKMGDTCVGSGGAGGGGTGGTGMMGGCAGGDCPDPPTGVMGCSSCGGCPNDWPISWDAVEGADKYIVRYACTIFPGPAFETTETTATLCADLGVCSNGLCANGGLSVTVEACNANGCSAPVQFTSGLPIACGGGVCC